ncbi:hypothetical protein [Pseudomonas piscis]|nr:hypothetical protein [Pseudomonas piscis]MCU7646565.1 hypothetical protein [Pseudomonas piscis]
MTPSPVKSLIDEQLADICAHNLRDAYLISAFSVIRKASCM